MPPHDETQLEGQQSNWTTGKVVAVAATTAALAGILTATALGLLSAGDDDERPPIIVSNGSIEFRPDATLNSNKGEWTRQTSSNVWKHTRQGRQGPRFLQVKASPNEKVCSDNVGKDFRTPLTGNRIEIDYGKSLTQGEYHTAIVSVAMRDLLLDTGTDQVVDDSINRKLVVYQNDDAVRVLQIRVGDTTCTFTGSPTLKIYQLR